MRTHQLSRREFARAAVSAAAVIGGGPALDAYARQQPAGGRGNQPAATTPKPDALKSEFLMDLELETGGAGSGSVAFETASEKYAWLNRIAAVGVSYTVPQRVSYRIFQIL